MTDPSDRRSEKQDETVPQSIRRAWRDLPDSEPPDLVDLAVLNQARAAVETPAPSRSSRPWSFGWPHALATLGVLVLAVTLILPMRDTQQPASVNGMDSVPSSVSPDLRPQFHRATDATDAGEALLEDRVENQAAPASRLRRDLATQPPETRASQATRAAPTLEKAQAAPARSSADASSVRAAEKELDPDVAAEIRRIRALAEAGDWPAAQEAATAFRSRFPDSKLPPELNELLTRQADELRP